MKRQDLFKISSFGAVILFFAMYGYFWYSAGLVGFSYPLRQVIWAVILVLIYAISTVSASQSQYLERKHSIVFFCVTITPVIINFMFALIGGEILDFATGFAYTMFVIIILISLSYFVSIFLKE